jgi:hypothetical protein
MAIKFLHTADWQMGMKASPAGEKAREVRRKRFETAARIAELAKRENVDFVLLVGLQLSARSVCGYIQTRVRHSILGA